MSKSVSEKLTEFFSFSKTYDYKKGEIFLRSEDPPPGVFYLEDGFIKMNSIFADGRELTLNIFKPGTYFPMTWVIANIPNSNYYLAMTNLKVKKMPKDTFLKFLNQNPDILWEFTTRILIGLDGLLTNIQYQMTGDAYHRLAAAVLLCARRFGEKDSNGQIDIMLPLTHQDLANIAGVTRETASVAIGKLKKLKIISFNYRHLFVKNSDELNRISLLPNEAI
jgi:CRP-like cAMP-binding protein